MRTLLAVIALFAGSATAGPIVDDAASALKRDPVYVSPDADIEVSSGDASRIRQAITDGDRAVYVAVLPTAAADEVGGDLNRLPAAIHDAVGLSGTYAVVTGKGFRAYNPSASVDQLATNAFNDHRADGAGAVLLAFVQAVESADAGGTGSGAGSGSGSTDSSGGGGTSPFTWVLVGGALLFGFYLFRNNSRRRKQEQVVLLGDQEDLRAELSVLADDVMRLEDDVTIHPEARDDYEAGVARYKWAQAAIDSIDSPDDIPRVRRGMAEAQYAMARARAIIRGQEPPAPPAELQQPGPYGEPAVELDEQRHPVYVGYGGYGGGWGGGGFFGGNGLFTGLLLGQMLGGHGWGGGFGWGGGGHDRGDGDGGGMFGGFGGGIGGGIGGGDWGGGGGDVGGGDW